MRKKVNKNSKAILIDISKCTGCEKCVDACVADNNLKPVLHLETEKRDNLSGNRFTSVVQLTENRFAKKSCLHCLDPGCASACIAGAITKTAEGPVIYNSDICIGCRYCMLACPVGIPRYEWDKTVPYIKKCDMCYDRLLEGKLPACVEACPNGVLTFGRRKELLQKANETVKSSPGKYIQHVFGQYEFGGTSLLYITDTPVDKLGFSTKIREKAITDYTWPIISKTPILGGSVMAFLTGAVFIINRRIKLENEQQEVKLEKKPSDNGKKTE